MDQEQRDIHHKKRKKEAKREEKEAGHLGSRSPLYKVVSLSKGEVVNWAD